MCQPAACAVPQRPAVFAGECLQIGHAARSIVVIASTAAMRWPIQRITGTAIELPSAL
jgi:hypothetical protein